MPTPNAFKLNTKPPNATALTPKAVAAPSGTTLARVKFCLQPYTSVRPIKDQYHVGALCKDLDFLGADLNLEFSIPSNKKYWKGEIEGDWSVRYLADYTDLKLK